VQEGAERGGTQEGGERGGTQEGGERGGTQESCETQRHKDIKKKVKT